MQLCTSYKEEPPAVVAECLRKRFGTTVALDGFDLRVAAGTIHGLLGPNGAGKTTAVRVLTTLLRPDAGRAEVAGVDAIRHPTGARRRLGLVGQHPALDEVLTGRQNLIMFGRLSHLSGRDARRRANELLERFALSEEADRPLKGYSGGMRRRLDISAGLLLKPAVLFLDEPTTGLDPRGRNEVWGAVRGLVADGTTVLLTTQQLDEADQLASMITVVDRGRVIVEGSPDHLKARMGGDRFDVVVRRGNQLREAAAVAARVANAEPTVDEDSRRVSAPVRDRGEGLMALVRALDAQGIETEDVAVRRPTLDEVFLEVTR